METLCRMCDKSCKTEKMKKGNLVFCTRMPEELKVSQADAYERVEERRKKKEEKGE